ncbi:hypothetical protein OG323_06325 [Streptomyces cyaneofuscatus]|uniref:hypothetical protein n=1 Tax=Streptomyces cyaneofuscatus TaxID=66883 RepID=UPI00386BFF14|nr:hypothetical protein OG323_06325 [Streptomyces cyaneofuscatus]
MTTQPERLRHLLDRARRGVILPAEGEQLAGAVRILQARVSDQDGAASVAVSAVRLMNQAGAQRDRAAARIRELEAEVVRLTAVPDRTTLPDLHQRIVDAVTTAWPDLRFVADDLGHLVLAARDQHIEQLERRIAELAAGQCTHTTTP